MPNSFVGKLWQFFEGFREAIFAKMSLTLSKKFLDSLDWVPFGDHNEQNIPFVSVRTLARYVNVLLYLAQAFTEPPIIHAVSLPKKSKKKKHP